MRNCALILTLGLLFSDRAIAEESCVDATIHEQVTSCLPQVVSQGDSRWCFAHAGHALLAQKVCQSGVAPADRVSLRGVLEIYNSHQLGTSPDTGKTFPYDTGYHWEEGGFTWDVLFAASQLNKVADEKCAPTKDFLNWVKTLPKESADSPMSPMDVLKFLYGQYRLDQNIKGMSVRCAGLDIENVINKKSQFLDLSRFARDIGESAMADKTGSVSSFVSGVLVPPRCEASGLALPPMTPKTANPAGADEIRKAIESVLARNKSVAAGVGEIRKDGWSNHEIVIGGMRTTCCHEVCNTEYKILDSDSEDPHSLTHTTPWVAAEKVVKEIEVSQGMSKAGREAMDKKLSKIKSELSQTGRPGEGALRDAIKHNDIDKAAKILFADEYAREFDLERDERDLNEMKTKSDVLVWLEEPAPAADKSSH